LDTRDRLINLLPEEYLPEPEFKAFPIFAAALVILTVLFIWFQYQADIRGVTHLRRQLAEIRTENDQYMIDAQAFVDVQANARFISSYLGIIPRVVQMAPDYWEIYNEIERHLPDDTWVTSVAFRPGRGSMPRLVINFLSKGYSFNGPLQTYDSFKGTNQNPTRFKALRMGGYSRTFIQGIPLATFQIQMDVRQPNDLGWEQPVGQEVTATDEPVREDSD
jgi:hypothetical protein